MRTIGIRAQPGEPDSIFWAVVDGPREQPILVAHDQTEAQADAGEAEALAWFPGRGQRPKPAVFEQACQPAEQA